jgi:Zn-dependent peptidase ImmA (M78 family)
MSEIAGQLCNTVYTELPAAAFEFRRKFLEHYGVVTLANMLDFLWSSGIPVFYVPEFPAGLKKMDGLVVRVSDRPVIILSKNRKHEAWLLFVLLHETAHIQCGHLSGMDKAVYDEDISGISQDVPEKEANEWALQFILEQGSIPFFNEKITSAFKLLNYARKTGAELQIDPGLVMLIYAYRNNRFALASDALNIMYPDANAIQVIKSKMRDRINLDNLSEEDGEFLSKLTSLPEV